MGAWGPAVFSDDTACDVRDSYREEIANGVEGSDATQKVLAQFVGLMDDPDDGPVVWFALAATQSRLGRLEDQVRARALELIDAGAGLDLWEEQSPKLLEKRKAALQRLREQLLSPQPPPRKVRKPFCPEIYLDIKVGDAISYQMQSGEYVIFRCVDRKYGFVRFDVLDWTGGSLPRPSEISRMPCARETTGRPNDVFTIDASRKRDFPADRVRLVARGLRFHQPDATSPTYWGIDWETIEEDILKHFNLTPGGRRGLRRWFGR